MKTTPPYREQHPVHGARYALALLFLVMMLNFLDRQIIAILAEPIKTDLGLSDTQVGLMSGLSFAIFYTTLGLPIALLADRWHRTRIIAIAIGIWSTMTMLCGLAAGFTQLFLARIGVGIGEAGSGPASHSLIADLFPPERRAGALGVFGAAVPIGAFFAYAGGGWIVETLGWRIAFLAAGAPGIAVGLLIWLTVREPRGHLPLAAAFRPDPARVSLRDALPGLAKASSYWHLIAAGALVQFVAYGFASFYGGFFVRIHGLDYGELGLKLGIMVGVVGGLGAYLGGHLGDRTTRAGTGVPLLVNAAILVLSVPLMIAGLYAPSADIAFLYFAAPTFAGTWYYGTTFSSLQVLARDETRAIAVAIFLLISSLVGIGLGPVFVGALSDIISTLRDGEAGAGGNLRLAIAVLAFFNAWAGLHFCLAARTLKADSLQAAEPVTPAAPFPATDL